MKKIILESPMGKHTIQEVEGEPRQLLVDFHCPNCHVEHTAVFAPTDRFALHDDGTMRIFAMKALV